MEKPRSANSASAANRRIIAKGLGGSVSSVQAVLKTSTGLVDVIGLGNDSAIWRLEHVSGTGWSTWTSLGGNFTSDPSGLFDSTGSLEIFARGTDNALYRNLNNSWGSLGGYLASGPTAALNQDGRVAVFVEGGDTTLWILE